MSKSMHKTLAVQIDKKYEGVDTIKGTIGEATEGINEAQKTGCELIADGMLLQQKFKFIEGLENIDNSQKLELLREISVEAKNLQQSYYENVEAVFEENEEIIRSVLDIGNKKADDNKKVQEQFDNVNYQSIEKGTLETASDKIKKEAGEKETEYRKLVADETRALNAKIEIQKELRRQMMRDSMK